MLKPIKILVDKKHHFGNLKAGIVGRGYWNKDQEFYRVWFQEQRKEFYWYPITLTKSEAEFFEKEKK